MFSAKRLLWLVLAGIVLVLFAPRLKTEQQSSLNDDELASQMAEEIRQVLNKRYPSGTVKRFNQVKSLGCFEGAFTVNPQVPEQFKKGIFATPASYPAMLRFASASKEDDREKDLRGLSIRVSGVQGEVLWGQPGLQDFVLNSYPALFAATPEDFLGFIRAQKDDSMLWYFLNPFDSHLKALWILLQARDRPNSPFDIRYFSTTAYGLGHEDMAVKYAVKPCSDYVSQKPEQYSQNYLREAMHRHLQQAPVCFDFMLQQQTDPGSMPLDDPSVEWDEEASPYVPVARLEFAQQPFLTRTALDACETVSFNPWQSLVEHPPVGRMNYVRRQIYAELAAFRQQANN